MPINPSVPDYDLDDTLELTTPAQVRAISDSLRMTLLDLLHERAATVTELATAVGRPKSTVAHHVNVMVDAGLLRVVRTRRVRAIEERYYGRTARVVYVGLGQRPGGATIPPDQNDFAVAAEESAPAHDAHQLRSLIRHARIAPERAAEFWSRVEDLVRDFAQTPRSGDTVYGFVVGLYPTDYPTLPAADDHDPGGGT
ncbi:MAG: helix-turn-helix domain-containing protein [Streptosporangiales bacterium]|nr:helix-turn-helix domain-containing protein [Streptosporangiales bacterium]